MSRETAINAGIVQPTSPKSGPKAGGAVALAVSPPASPSNNNSTKPVIASSQPRSDTSNPSATNSTGARAKLEGEVVMWGSMRKTQFLWVATLVMSTALIVCVVAPQWFLFTNTQSELKSHRGLWDWQTPWEVDSDCNPTSNQPGIPKWPYLHTQALCQKFYSVRAFAALSILAGLIALYFLHFHHRFRALIFCVIQVICSMLTFSIADSAFRDSLYESSRTNTVGFILIVFGWVMALICVLVTCLRLFNLSLVCGYAAHFLFCVACADAEWIAAYANSLSTDVWYLSPFGFGQQYDSNGASMGVSPLNQTEQIIAQGFGVGAFVSLCVAATFMYSRFKHYAHYFYSSAALGCLLSWAFALPLFRGTATDFGLSFWMYVIMTAPLFLLIYFVHPDYNPEMIAHLPPEQRANYGNASE